MDFINSFVEDLDFYIDGRKCECDEFLERVDILPKENESDILRLSIVHDILDIIDCCDTECDLIDELLEYFSDIDIEIIE